ncbi:MAG: TlpA disulfide reductase family protein, partial [Clostridium sp.]
MNGITGYLSQTANKRTNIEETQITATDRIPAVETNQAEETDPSTAQDQVIAPDFTLLDQNGEEHTLSDYQGKVVFLNFWATWCPPCRAEMPDIQKLYEEYGGNAEDLVILGVANPKTTEHPSNQDGTVEEVGQFLKDGAYTYPVVMDITGSVLSDYYVSSFPTTFMIDREGMVFGYVTGTLSEEIMRDIIQQTMSGKRNPS